MLLASALVAVVALLFLRKRLIYWHSHLEVELQSVMSSADQQMTLTATPWLKPHGDWNLQMVDCVLPDLADAQGRKISELDLRARFGCSVVGIERQGPLEMDPRFTIPPYLGHNGWIALDASKGVNASELREFLVESYRHFAPRRALASLER